MATLVKDPKTGAMVPTDGTSRDLSGLSGGSPDGAPSSSADKFNLALMGILREAQQSGSTAPLYASKDELQNEKLNLSNPLADTPYAPIFQGMGYASTNAEKGTQNAFEPGITSIESQIASSNDAATKFNDMAGTALAISQNNKNIVAPGQSIVDNNGNVLYKGHSYTPTPNPKTGTIDGFDSVTGTWLSDAQTQDKTDMTTPPAGSNVVVGGVDLSGASTGSKPYAADPNYSVEVNGIYHSLQKGMPVPNAPALDQYIQGHAKGSGITGAMVMNSAVTYGIDPILLASILAQESDFGTAGAGSKTNNPGNVGNTDNGITQSFASMQKGVNAAAAELAKRMPGNPNAGKPSGSLDEATQGTGSPVGGTFSSEAAQKINTLAPGLKSYVDAGPKGVAYMNDSRVPDTLKQVALMQASKAGIPYLSSGEADNVKNIGLVYDSMEKLKGLASQVLGPGLIGRINGLTFNQAAQGTETGAGPTLKQFDQYRSQAINNLKALTAGGTTFRITQTEIDTAVGNIPSSADNIETAKKDLETLQTFMDSKLASTFPYLQGGQPGGSTQPKTTSKNPLGI